MAGEKFFRHRWEAGCVATNNKDEDEEGEAVEEGKQQEKEVSSRVDLGHSVHSVVRARPSYRGAAE